jgi:hypothetical protein
MTDELDTMPSSAPPEPDSVFICKDCNLPINRCKCVGQSSMMTIPTPPPFEGSHCTFVSNQLVAFEWNSPESPEQRGYPFNPNEVMLFLGEILQMPGHCVVVRRSGQVVWGYHTDNFREPTDDEI